LLLCEAFTVAMAATVSTATAIKFFTGSSKHTFTHITSYFINSASSTAVLLHSIASATVSCYYLRRVDDHKNI